jgi:hypothetical protein
MEKIICQMDVIDSEMDRWVRGLTVLASLFQNLSINRRGLTPNAKNSALAIKGCPKANLYP